MPIQNVPLSEPKLATCFIRLETAGIATLPQTYPIYQGVIGVGGGQPPYPSANVVPLAVTFGGKIMKD